MLLGNSFKVLGLSSTSFGDDPFISVFPIQFCLLTEIMSHIHLFRACLVSLLKQICVQIDFQRFRQIQESNSKYQSVSRELVVHSMHCTQFNCFQYFINLHPSHLISHLHQYLQQLILVILFAPMYFDARKRLPKSAFCDNIFLQPKIMQNVGSKCKM